MSSLFSEFPNISTDSILLGRITESDLDALYEIYRNPNVFTYIPGSAKKSKETVLHMIGHFERDFRKKKMIFLGVFRKENPNELIGTAEIFEYNPKVNKVVIGYRFNESCWGRGAATETVHAMVGYLFDTVGLNRIEAYVMPQNAASQRVLEKNGFIREGLLRQANLWTDKGIVDLIVYSLLRSDVR